MTTLTLTYQARASSLDEREAAILEEYAFLCSRVERSLYVEVNKGNTPGPCKSHYLKKYGITARQFNACHINLKAKIESCRSAQQQTIFTLKQKIEQISGQIQRLSKKETKKF